jgi:hypothetical protein
MHKPGFHYHMLTTVCAALAIALASGASTSRAIVSGPPASPSADADLSADARTLDGFVDDLGKFNRRWVDAGKKSSLSHAEFDPLQRNADDLKRRLSGFQDTVQDIVRRLKASGQWDGLDQIVLAKLGNAKAQAHFRQNSFKQVLEDASSQLTNDASEISSPLEALRAKLTARADYSTPDTWRMLPASYRPEPVAVKFSLACKLSNVRIGISGFVHGKPTDAALDAFECACTNTNCFVW